MGPLFQVRHFIWRNVPSGVQAFPALNSTQKETILIFFSKKSLIFLSQQPTSHGSRTPQGLGVSGPWLSNAQPLLLSLMGSAPSRDQELVTSLGSPHREWTV